jgi:hypothetical protein
MIQLSANSKRYLKIFDRLIRLYPKRYQREYGHAMVQLLADQLTDAERFGEQRILKETFLHAVFGLLGSILQEYLHPGKSEPQGTLAIQPVPTWRGATAVFYTCFFLGLLLESRSAPTLHTVGIILLGLSWLVPIIVSFRATRRLVLLCIALLMGLGTLFVIRSVFEGASASLGGDAMYYFYLPTSTVLARVLPPLVMYGLMSWYVLAPQRFRRHAMASLTEAEITALRIIIQRRRRKTLRITLGLFAVIILLNLAGLYDPSVSHADLDLPTIQVADADNMYSDLNQLPTHFTSGLTTPGFPHDPTTSNPTTVGELVAANAVAIDRYRAAAQKSMFQEPAFADLGRYQNARDFANTPIMSLGPVVDISNLLLDRAEQSRRNHRLADALTDVGQVLTVSDTVLSTGQGVIITQLAVESIQNMALRYLQVVTTQEELSEGERAQVSAMISALHNPVDGAVRALKVEYVSNRLFVTRLRPAAFHSWQGASSDRALLVPALFPYTFQPNRTLARVSERARQEINHLQGLCVEQAGLTDWSGMRSFGLSLKVLGFNGLGNLYSGFVVRSTRLKENICETESLKEAIQKELQHD